MSLVWPCHALIKTVPANANQVQTSQLPLRCQSTASLRQAHGMCVCACVCVSVCACVCVCVYSCTLVLCKPSLVRTQTGFGRDFSPPSINENALKVCFVQLNQSWAKTQRGKILVRRRRMSICCHFRTSFATWQLRSSCMFSASSDEQMAAAPHCSALYIAHGPSWKHG